MFRYQGNYFLNIGKIFIDGFMDGEAVDGLADRKYMLENFELHQCQILEILKISIIDSISILGSRRTETCASCN
jgi:hypothetical protein